MHLARDGAEGGDVIAHRPGSSRSLAFEWDDATVDCRCCRCCRRHPRGDCYGNGVCRRSLLDVLEGVDEGHEQWADVTVSGDEECAEGGSSDSNEYEDDFDTYV